jgi:uncharacterized protein YdaT
LHDLDGRRDSHCLDVATVFAKSSLIGGEVQDREVENIERLDDGATRTADHTAVSFFELMGQTERQRERQRETEEGYEQNQGEVNRRKETMIKEAISQFTQSRL